MVILEPRDFVSIGSYPARLRDSEVQVFAQQFEGTTQSLSELDVGDAPAIPSAMRWNDETREVLKDYQPSAQGYEAMNNAPRRSVHRFRH